jgi:hypothetical protein
MANRPSHRPLPAAATVIAAANRFNNAPSYFGNAASDEVAAAKGRPALWRKAVGDSVDVEELRNAWEADRNDELFAALEVLESTAAALGWEHDSMFAGYKHATESHAVSHTVQKRGPGMIELRWRHAAAKESPASALLPTSFAKHFFSWLLISSKHTEYCMQDSGSVSCYDRVNRASRARP